MLNYFDATLTGLNQVNDRGCLPTAHQEGHSASFPNTLDNSKLRESFGVQYLAQGRPKCQCASN